MTSVVTIFGLCSALLPASIGVVAIITGDAARAPIFFGIAAFWVAAIVWYRRTSRRT